MATAIPTGEGLTFEKVWLMFKESDRKFEEMEEKSEKNGKRKERNGKRRDAQTGETVRLLNDEKFQPKHR